MAARHELCRKYLLDGTNGFSAQNYGRLPPFCVRLSSKTKRQPEEASHALVFPTCAMKAPLLI